MGYGGRRVPSDAEWNRLAVAFGLFFAATAGVTVLFVSLSPFPPLVGILLMSPPMLVTGWIWFVVVLRRDAELLGRLQTFAARRGRRRRR